MIRALTVAFALLAVTACADQDRADAYKAEQDTHHRKCVTYGFAPGSADYGHCRQRFDEMNHNAAVARRAVITQHLLQRTIVRRRAGVYPGRRGQYRANQ